MATTYRYYLCINDHRADERTESRIGDIIRTKDDKSERNWRPLTHEQTRQLRKVQTRLHNIDKEQNFCYGKDSYHTNRGAWRVSRKLDGLAIEERYWRKRYNQLASNYSGIELSIIRTPQFGYRQI